MHSHVRNHETWVCSHTSLNHACHSILSPPALSQCAPMHFYHLTNRIVQLNLLNTQAGMGMCFLACTCSQAHDPKFTSSNTQKYSYCFFLSCAFVHTVPAFLLWITSTVTFTCMDAGSPVSMISLTVPQTWSVLHRQTPSLEVMRPVFTPVHDALCIREKVVHAMLPCITQPLSARSAQECMFLFLLYLRWTKLMNWASL